MNLKLLSIIVPSYNMEAYLPKCLGSLVIDDKELFNSLDVIVVNDGSKDRTGEIAHGFEAKYPGVFRVIDKENGHYGSCINAALPVAEGEYVKVLDADDSVDTCGLTRLLSVIREELDNGEQAADLVATDYVSVNPDGKILFRPTFGFNEGMTTLDEQGDEGTRLTIHAICYRMENIRRINYRQSEGIPYTDSEWIIEPMVTVRRMRYVQTVVTRYLIGRNGQTMDPKVLAKNFQAILDITQGLVERYERNALTCEKTSKNYYEKQVVEMIRMCYAWGLSGYCGTRLTGDLDKFDAALAHHSALYASAGELYRGPNYFPFRHIDYFRKHGCDLVWKIRYALGGFLIRIARSTGDSRPLCS